MSKLLAQHTRISDGVTYDDIPTAYSGPLLANQETDHAEALCGAQILAMSLKNEGVDVLFGYPGGANLEIFHVLRDYDIRCIRTAHEQGAAHAAEAYARATGKTGVCLATSGPGATNLVTGIADANSDSIPIVAITGNVPSHLLGKNAFQEVNIVEITKPITKKSILVEHVGDIPGVIHEAFTLASDQRPGPVLVDIPKNIQQHYPLDQNGCYKHPQIPVVVETPRPKVAGIPISQLEECSRLLSAARRPVIYAGGGVISSDSGTDLTALAEQLNCPVTLTLMGLGAFPPDHPLLFGALGMHGTHAANVAVNEADLVLALGVRFDDRVTGKPEEFIKYGKIIHIDIDPTELNKNKPATLAICADLRIALQQLTKCATKLASDNWLKYLISLTTDDSLRPTVESGLSGPYAITVLSEMTQGNALVTLGVGQHQMWAMQHYKVRRPRSLLSSSGFGTMGYGLPAAIGAKVGCPDRLVIDIDGDGSLNMSINELSTCHRYGLGVKIVVINNQWLGMVRQWQDMIYDGHRAESALSDPAAKAIPTREADIYPDFVAIANGYRVTAERVTIVSDLVDAYKRMLVEPNQPYLVDVAVRREDDVYPMIPAGGTYKDIILSKSDRLSNT